MKKTIVLSCISIASLFVSCKENSNKTEELLPEISTEANATDTAAEKEHYCFRNETPYTNEDGSHLVEVDFRKYIAELAELIKDSYDNHKKKITLNVLCEIQTISIEKALPLGLIITELVSNSMKHAFKKQNIGIINIQITKTQTGKQLYYSDNGSGFDFTKAKTD